MDAKDERSRTSESGPSRPGHGTGIARSVLAGLLLGAVLAVSIGPRLVAKHLPLFEARVPWRGPLPAPDEWSSPPGHGEAVEARAVGARTYLFAGARTPARAEALAVEAALMRLSRSSELAGRRSGSRARWFEALLRGPVATLSPAGDCAARLRGWAMAWRAAASGGGTHGDAGPAPAGGAAVSVTADVARLALATDAAGLESALRREARVARGRLFAGVGSLPPDRRAAAAEPWLRAWSATAEELDGIAEALETRMSRIERELIARVAPGYALDAEPHVADPGVVLLLSAPGAAPVTAGPVAGSWALFAAAGALAGALIATPLAWAAAGVRRARRDELMRQLLRETAEAFAAAPWTPSASVEARLQVVSGPRPRPVARVARELAARFVARGERVLVMDGGLSLRLHDSFGARPRLGFQECMREKLPLLGVVQRGGHPRLFFLAHGSASRLRSWIPLAGLLDQARPHFTRVVLALEPNVPRQVGDVLAGRLIDGWWASAHARAAKDARRFSTRIGIPMQRVEPASPEDAALDALVEAERPTPREPAVAPAPTPEEAAARTPAPEPEAAPAAATARSSETEAATGAMVSDAAARVAAPEPEAAPSPAVVLAHAPEPETPPTLAATLALVTADLAPAAAQEAAAQEAVVLDCDPEVNDRLRFLVWMRRLRAKARAEVAHPVA